MDEHPYVRKLIEALKARRAEEERVDRRGAREVNLDGVTAREILGFVKIHGGRTVQRLSRELNLGIKTIQGYARALERGKRVHLTSTRRGAVVVNPGPKPKRTRKKKKAAVAVARPVTQTVTAPGSNGCAA